MNRMIKIFIGILCFIAFFSYNNNDNISTAQINGATTTTIDDDMSSADGGVESPQAARHECRCAAGSRTKHLCRAL